MTTESQTHADKENSQKRQIAKPIPEGAGLEAAPVNAISALQRSVANPRLLAPAEVRVLQRTLGNQAVQRLLAKPQPGANPTLQLKRAKPRQGTDLQKYNLNEPQYNEAKRKGTGYLRTLQDRKGNLLESGEKPMDLWEKNYESALVLGYEFTTTMRVDADDDQGIVAYDMTTQHKTDEGNFYHNTIVLPAGQIIADNNQAGDNKFPPSNSEVLWHQYSMALADYKKNHAAQKGAANLSGISRQVITNPETNAVIWMVYDNDDDTEKTVSPATEDGKALLGTPNGKSSVWLLNDHLEEVGNKTIQSIDLEQDEDGQNMNINIG